MFNSPEYIVSTVGYTQEQLDAAVEAAIEATKEKAANVAAGMLNDLHAYGFGVPAAIRSMK